MVNLVDVLAQGANVGWLVARVKTIDTTKKKLTLVVGDLNNASAPQIRGASYLHSYIPIVGDVVHALTKDNQGVLVLGSIIGPSSILSTARAGRNRFINGDFSINQRGFVEAQLYGSGTVFGHDRWYGVAVNAGAGSTAYLSALTLGPSILPESTPSIAMLSSYTPNGPDHYVQMGQKIEDSGTLSGKRCTLSFWAWTAQAGNWKLGTTFVQNFGTGGAPSPNVTVQCGVATINSTVTRYSFTFDMPSIAGMVRGTAGDSRVTLLFTNSAGPNVTQFPGVGPQHVNTYIWGVQVEEGELATRFDKRSYGEELRACQRYFQRWQQPPLRGMTAGADLIGRIGMPLPVPMRAKPAPALSGPIRVYDGSSTGEITSLPTDYSTSMFIEYDAYVTAFTAPGRPAIIYQYGANYLDLNAEL